MAEGPSTAFHRLRNSYNQMDIVYHYPPELFELLIDAIPRLCRSKDSVIDFFRGAGVEAKDLAEPRELLRNQRDKTPKAKIVRIVLNLLNERAKER